MRNIIKAYIRSWRESGELDVFLPKILSDMGFRIYSYPKSGTRQYGVDVVAAGYCPDTKEDTLYLITIKQQDITREVWSRSVQGIEASLNEIFSTYIPTHLDDNVKNLPRRVILCTNGNMESDVIINWTQYTRQRTVNGTTFDFWNIDALTSMVERFMFNSQVFHTDIYSKVQRIMIYMDDNKYNLSHVNELIDIVLSTQNPQINAVMSSINQDIKKMKMLNMCLAILISHAKHISNLKHAIHICEKFLLQSWSWLCQHNHSNNDIIMTEFEKLDMCRMHVSREYISKIKPYISCSYSFAAGLTGRGGEMGYRMTLMDQIGIISSIGLSEYYVDPTSIRNEACECLKILFNNIPACSQPVYDAHIHVISMSLLLLYLTQEYEVLDCWLDQLVQNIYMRDKLYNQFLLVGHIYDNLTPDNIKESSKSTHNSTFLAILSEWCIMRNRNFSLLGEKSTNLTLQVWIPGMKTEDYMYTQCAQHTGASQIYAHPIDVGDVVKQHKYDEHSPNLSFIKLKRRCIGIISARHYGTPLTPLYWREHINKCMF